MAPVEDPEPLAIEIERRLIDAAPFLTKTECQTLAVQMAEGFICYPEQEDPSELLLDWIWDKAEREPNIALENHCPVEMQAMFEEPGSIEELLARITNFCNEQPGDFTNWLSNIVQTWLDMQQAKQAMSEEEKLTEFLNSLPQKVFGKLRKSSFFTAA